MLKTPHGYDAVVAEFGDCRSSTFAGINIVSQPIPFSMLYRDNEGEAWTDVSRVRVHKLIAPQVVLALTTIWNHAREEVKKNAGYTGHTSEQYDSLTHEWLAAHRLNEYGGGYNFRNIRGMTSHLSMHAFGIALDFSPELYPRGSSKRMPDWWIKAWQDAGFFYGGDFSTTKDPMHVQYAIGC